ncbi:MAG: hypothetical protein J0L73_10740 [Verrucomicrobia bacterium]|nr:hypothetical protein [Verrucomicrobiota bacterium]
MNDDTDNSRQTSNSSAITVVVLALPLLYALSMGPVAFVFGRYHSLKSMEKAAQAFYAPMFWLHAHTFLKEPLEYYLGWWERLARK